MPGSHASPDTPPLTPAKAPVIGLAIDMVVALASVGVATAGSMAVDSIVGMSPQVSILLCSIMFVAWVRGTGAAMLATLLAALSFDFFFLGAGRAFSLNPSALPRLAFFLIAALFVVALSAAYRRTADSLRRARDEQSMMVTELRRLNEDLQVENLERRKAEQKALEAERELQVTMDSIPALVGTYGPDGSRLMANKRAREYTGLSAQDITSGQWRIAMHPDDIELAESKWRESIATGEPLEIEYRTRRADGVYRWHMARRVPLRNQNGQVVRWYSVSHDIEDQKRAEDALRQSEARLAATMNAIPTLVASYGPDGRRDFVNAAWKRYTGLAPDEALDTEWFTTVHPDDIAEGDRRWREALSRGQALRIEQRFRRADGEYRWFMVDRIPIRDDNGTVIKWYSTGNDIHDQKLAENALRESQQRLAIAEREMRLMLDTIPSLAWRAGPNGYVDYLNKRWYEYTGTTPAEMRGRRWQSTIHPDDLGPLLDIGREYGVTEISKDGEARVRRHDGEYRWFLFRPAPLRDEAGKVVGWFGTITDIEDRKRAEVALQRSEAYLAEAQRVSRTGSFGWNLQSGNLYWSDQTFDIMGVDRTMTPTLDLIMQQVHPDDRPALQRELQGVAQDSKTLDIEHRLLLPSGEVRYVHVIGHRVGYLSGTEEVTGAVQDTTEVKRAQEALQTAQANLAHASRVATLGEISASIAHEVNQPLAAIVANAQACLRFLRRDKPDLNDVRGAVEWIVNDGIRASEVIRRLRGLLKKSEPQMLPLDVNSVVREVAVLLQRELNAQRVRLRLELARDISTIVADRIQLQQVIINLVMNGIDAMRATAKAELTISTVADGDSMVVSVADSGAGFGDENPDRLFQAFFSTKPGGLGIGLAVCRSIVEAHGGRIWALANDDAGTTFLFALPAQQDYPSTDATSMPLAMTH